MPTLLVVDDEEPLARNIARYLDPRGWDVCIALSAEDALSRVAKLGPDVILLDFNLPGVTGLAAIEMLIQRDPHARIVMLTGQPSVQLAVDAMKAGARDFLMKPLSLASLEGLLKKITIEVRSGKENAYRKEKSRSSVEEIVGESAAMVDLKKRIRRIAQMEPREGRPPPVLITGETGVGKELVAQACHFESPRAGGPFLEVNCAAIPVHLLESELFGHERGAFSGASDRRIGLIEAADGGTLFLDEIGEMEGALQAKLLKFLDDHRVRRLGGVHDRRVDVRIVSATNQDLGGQIEAGLFRADLYHRLGVIRLNVPALRERREDIPMLACHFVQDLGKKYRRPGMKISEQAIAALVKNQWPGNVRELMNQIERAIFNCTEGVIEAMDVSSEDRWAATPKTVSTESELDKVQGKLIRDSLEMADWNVVKAAANLGVTRDTLRYRMKRLGLQRPQESHGGC
jgi:two-component system, NtrC family, response regulator AtoC